ncbi:hypothetical protein [Alkalimarinus coralli]|uniref:hypothetical protein n=1 Tax=Alkalimarinus coralli TaxID=2935863 RepID=UPI00202AD192|nr:hypothetical protein [Alkalimarinus coralli]
MSESRDYLEMTFQSINCFADDGKLDAEELSKIFAIAQRDGVVDDNEKRVLTNIISKVKPEELDQDMLEIMNSIKREITA